MLERIYNHPAFGPVMVIIFIVFFAGMFLGSAITAHQACTAMGFDTGKVDFIHGIECVNELAVPADELAPVFKGE